MRKLTALLLLLVASFGGISTLLYPATASATGEKYIWSNKQEIAASGGRYKEPATFRATDSTSTSFTAAIRDIAGCETNAYIKITSSDKSKGTFSILPDIISTTDSSCTDKDFASKYDSSITIGNTGKASAEPVVSANDTSVKVQSGVPNDSEFPGTSDSFTLTENGKKIGDSVAGTPFKDSTIKGYEATFTGLKVGFTYVVCSNALDKCTTFEKTKSDPLAGSTIQKVSIVKDPSAPVPTCEDNAGALGWMTCKILTLLGNTLDALDKILNGLLKIDEDYINSSDAKDAWARFRNLAYIILVPILLVMVIGTALGFDFISAYTVKKALPRLVIAAVFISLSFEILKFAVIATNNIGEGMLGFLSGAGGAHSLEDLFKGSLASDAGIMGLILGGGFIAGSAALTGGIFALAGFFGAAAIALLVVVLLLAFRQVLIIILVVLAPLAVLSWIFPGNDKLWKAWKGSFIGLLLLYPVIMIAIGGGRLFAGLINVAGANDQNAIRGILDAILKLSAYILPYFLIPYLFKSAGGAFSSVLGMVNNKQRGLMDRSRGWGKHRRETSAGYTAKQTRNAMREKSRTGAGRLHAFDSMGQDGLRGRLARRGIQDESVIAGAKREATSEKYKAADAALYNETINTNMPRSKRLEYLKNTALDDPDDYRKQAAIARLTQEKDVESLRAVKNEARRRSQVNPEDVKLLNNFNQAMGDNFGDMKSISPDLAKEIGVGQTEEHAINEAKQQFLYSSPTQHAEMKPDGWREWNRLDPINARAAYNVVMSNEKSASVVNGEVHTIFAPRPPASSGPSSPPAAPHSNQPDQHGGI